MAEPAKPAAIRALGVASSSKRKKCCMRSCRGATLSMGVKREVSRQASAPLAPLTTLPIQLERSIDSNHEHAGGVIAAMMTQTFEATILGGIFLAYFAYWLKTPVSSRLYHSPNPSRSQRRIFNLSRVSSGTRTNCSQEDPGRLPVSLALPTDQSRNA